jgi:hypothetical protein
MLSFVTEELAIVFRTATAMAEAHGGGGEELESLSAFLSLDCYHQQRATARFGFSSVA